METTQLSVFQQTIKKEEEWIFVKPLCDFFQIDYENQVDKIRNDSILASQSVKKPNEKLFGENRQRVCLSQKGFIRWIQLINPNTLPEELREKFMQYQADVFDFFYGTAQEADMIRKLIEDKNECDHFLTLYATKKRKIVKSLDRALCDRYQRSLPF